MIVGAILLALASADGEGLPPSELVRLLREARIAELSQQTTAAQAKLEEAVELHPLDPLPLLELLAFHRRNAVAGLDDAVLRERLRARLADAEAPVTPGVLAYLVERPGLSDDEARLILAAIQARQAGGANDARLLDAAAKLHLDLDQFAEAWEVFQRLLAARPDDAAVHAVCVRLAVQLERWEDVVRLIEPRIGTSAADPGDSILYIEALGKLGRTDAALARLQALTESIGPAGMATIGTTVQSLLWQMAWDLRDLGREAEAEAVFRGLLEKDPGNQAVREALLLLYGSEEDWAQHEAAVEQSWADEEDPHVLLDRGSNLLVAGDAPRAVPLLRRAAAALATSEVAWYNLGLAALEVEDLALAEEALVHSTRINPARASGFLNLGAALQKLGRCAEALAPLEHALELEPDLVQTHYFLYECYKALGQMDKAAEALRLYQQPR